MWGPRNGPSLPPQMPVVCPLYARTRQKMVETIQSTWTRNHGGDVTRWRRRAHVRRGVAAGGNGGGCIRPKHRKRDVGATIRSADRTEPGRKNLYAHMRRQMMQAIRAAWPHEITEEVLLGGGAMRMPDEAWQLVAAAVAAFVRSTGRDV